jgi:hypothetical protein
VWRRHGEEQGKTVKRISQKILSRRVFNLQLFAVVNRIWNNVIKSIALDQESHEATNVIRNVIFLGKSRAQLKPAGFSHKHAQLANDSHIASPIQPASTASCTKSPREASQISHVMGEAEGMESSVESWLP